MSGDTNGSALGVWLSCAVAVAVVGCGGGAASPGASSPDAAGSSAPAPDAPRSVSDGSSALPASDGSVRPPDVATDTTLGSAADSADAPPQNPSPTTDAPLAVDAIPAATPAAELFHLAFDEGAGATVKDSSQSTISVNVVGKPAPEWTAGKVGSALRFDGSYRLELQVRGLPGAAAGWTVAAWMKPERREAPQEVCACQTALMGGAPMRNASSWLGLYMGTPSAGRANGRAGVAGRPLALGQWHHVAGTYRPGRLEIFLDGASVRVVGPGDLPGLDLQVTPSELVRIGGGEGTGSPWFGALDEIRMFARVLPADEIRALARQ